MLFERMVAGQAVVSNPAHAARWHLAIKGATTVMSSREAAEYLKGNDVSHVAG